MCLALDLQNASGAEGDPDTLEQNTLDNLKASGYTYYGAA